MGLIEAIILSVLAASTPLLLAATGELVTEKSGVHQRSRGSLWPCQESKTSSSACG